MKTLMFALYTSKKKFNRHKNITKYTKVLCIDYNGA